MCKRCVIYTSADSKNLQSNDIQIASLCDFAEREGLEVFYIFEEVTNGTQEERPAMQDCLNFLRFNPEVVLLVSDISKIGSTVKEAIKRIDKLKQKGTPIYIQDINLWTLFADGNKNPMSKILLKMLTLGAELERKAIMGRLNSGRERAKERGVKMGRPTGTKMTQSELLDKYPEVVSSLRKGFSIRNTAHFCSVSNSTVQRVKIAMNQRSNSDKKSIA